MSVSLSQAFAKQKSAMAIILKLQSQGHRALIAGGAVRDALLGREVNDIDIATSASPDQIEALFAKTVSVGKAFGVIVVVEGEESFEVATFRQDLEYKDGRKPTSVKLQCTPKEDAERRDFTINAMFFDPQSQEILDYFGGQKDLAAKIIRCVGQPSLRFAEDHLRVLRALRFAAQLEFEIETQTFEAVMQGLESVLKTSRERITVELQKIINAKAPVKALAILESQGFLKKLGLDLDETKAALLVDSNYWAESSSLSVEENWMNFFFLLKKGRSLSTSLRLSKVLLKINERLESLRILAQVDDSTPQHLGQLIHVILGEANEEYSQEVFEARWRALELIYRFEKPSLKIDLLVLRANIEKFELNKYQVIPQVRADQAPAEKKGSELGAYLKQAYFEQLHRQFYLGQELDKNRILRSRQNV